MPQILTDWRTAYKLTARDGKTYNGCQWGKNVINPHGVRSGIGGLCGEGFYHAYVTPELAAFLNPIHASISDYRLWEVEIRGRVEEDGILKIGATEMRVCRELTAIRPTMLQTKAFAILVAQGILEATRIDIPVFTEWANNWLDGIDRTVEAASGATSAASWAASVASAASGATSAASWAASVASAASGATSAAEIIVDASILALSSDWT